MKKDLYILGISCFFHDSSVSLLKNGEIIFAVEEEKLSRIKHDSSFPENAIKACLNYCNISISDIDYVGFYEKPFIKFENFLKNYIKTYPFGYYGFIRGIKEWLKSKLFFKRILYKKTGYRGNVIYIDHHLSHAAGAFFSSGYEKSAILTVDGVGEESTTTWGIGEKNQIEVKEKIIFPNSVGLIYSAFTSYLGFAVNDGEYKMMGLAPYGKSIYVDIIKDKLIQIKDDGSFDINMSYFSFQYGRKMINNKFEKLFGQKTRNKNEEITQFHKDIAASIQKVTEELLFSIVNYIYSETKLENLCISGGVGLNCVANYYLFKKSNFKNIYVQPSPGDGGSSVGVCYYIYSCILGEKSKAFENIYLGEEFSYENIKLILKDYENKVSFEKIDIEKMTKNVSKLIMENNVIGWFQGRAEFGPRALGNRSILGNPLNKENWKKINLKIKFRESFRPFAPSIIEEELGKYYDLNGQYPYMLFVSKSKNDNLFPAVTHLDGTSRVQTINEKQNLKYYLLLKEFEKVSGFPILINTSFNLSSEPIVYSPIDALNTFLNCGMDYLVLGDYFISKK
ncbi:hypothetical protein EOM39_00095 [Candidatus Gracilibacteria bacterium]|nr:hypothetical protein [Candidatus Gracilibacteria bacterium]